MYILVLYSRSRFQFALDYCSLYVLCNSRECKTYVYSSLFVFFPPFRFLHVYVCVNINISVALALALSSSARVSSRSISLAHPLSLSQSLPPFLSLPFSPSTVSSSGEETHPRPLLTLTLDPLLHERALIFPFVSLLWPIKQKILLSRKMTRIPWSGCDDIDWSIARLRDDDELSDSLHVYSSCLRSTMDSMRTTMFFLLLLLLFLPFFLFSGRFLLLNFWLFFWLFLLIIYANLGRSFTVHHRAACRSREDGEGIGDHQIRV